MESIKNNSNSKTKAFLIIVGALSAIVFLTCILLHITPFFIAEYLADFAVHHYFLMGFISLTATVACWKMYTTLDIKIDERFQKKNIPYTRIKKKRNSMFKKLQEVYFKKDEDKSEFIKPEIVASLKFTTDDVLKDELARQQRQRDLQKAMVLGNSFKQKVILLFKDYKSKRHIITTVWHSNDEHISLKGGIILPVKSIYKIEF